jgi:predicted solute-binding protein
MSLVSLNDREPLAYSVADFCAVTGTRPAGVWNAIRRGEIQVARFGRRTLIPHKAAVEWLERLTVAKSSG